MQLFTMFTRENFFAFIFLCPSLICAFVSLYDFSIILFACFLVINVILPFLPQRIRINFNFNKLKRDNFGKNSEIEVVVFDKRPDKRLVGVKYSGSFLKFGSLKMRQDLAKFCQGRMVGLLKKRGFVISDKGLKLEINLLNLDYRSFKDAMRKKFFKSEKIVEVSSAISVIARDVYDNIKYEKVYYGNVKKGYWFSPLPSTNRLNINKSFGAAIYEIVNDRDLMNALV